MAMAKKVSFWQVIGSVWTAWYLFILAYVTIPDYPYDTPLWQSLTLDANGYWHEIWYLTVGWLSGIAIMLVIRFWSALASILEALDSIVGLPNGNIIVVRKRKRKGV